MRKGLSAPRTPTQDLLKRRYLVLLPIPDDVGRHCLEDFAKYLSILPCRPIPKLQELVGERVGDFLVFVGLGLVFRRVRNGPHERGDGFLPSLAELRRDEAKMFCFRTPS